MERGPLLGLPKEMIYKIIQDIGFEDIQQDVKAVTRFAMTSKQSLRLAEAAAGCALKDLVSLEKRFGRSGFNPDKIGWALSRRDDLKEKYADIPENGIGPDLDYLHLDGSLSWLTPLDDQTGEEWLTYCQGPAIGPRYLRKLIGRAKGLHLTLPPAFVRLIGNEELHNRIPSAFAAEFTCGNQFVKCPRKYDRNAAGYILRFLSDQQGCWYANLYLDPMGQHCVFTTGLDVNYADYCEEEEGERLTEVIQMETTSFEEYIYHLWMNELSGWTIPRGDELSEAQKMYIEHMRLKAREMGKQQ